MKYLNCNYSDKIDDKQAAHLTIFKLINVNINKMFVEGKDMDPWAVDVAFVVPIGPKNSESGDLFSVYIESRLAVWKTKLKTRIEYRYDFRITASSEHSDLALLQLVHYK